MAHKERLSRSMDEVKGQRMCPVGVPVPKEVCPLSLRLASLWLVRIGCIAGTLLWLISWNITGPEQESVCHLQAEELLCNHRSQPLKAVNMGRTPTCHRRSLSWVNPLPQVLGTSQSPETAPTILSAYNWDKVLFFLLLSWNLSPTHGAKSCSQHLRWILHLTLCL